MATIERAAPDLIRVEGVSVRFGQFVALEDVALSVGSGEIVTLIGPNGSGKTTLVRTVLGLLRPKSGGVWRRQGLRVGYMPQHFRVDPVLPMTVARFLGLGTGADAGARRAVLSEVGIPETMAQPVYALSGGQLRRLLLARTLVRDPELLVLDEPVQGVDLAGQHDLYRLIADLRRRRGCGVLLVSHDLHLVMRATDRVVCLNRHVCCTGHPEAVSRDPAYLALFGAEVAADLAVYAHDHDHVHDPAGAVLATESTASERPPDPP